MIAQVPKSRLQSNALRLLCAWFRRVFGEDYVEQEVSIDLNQALHATNEPEPDLLVLCRPFLDFRAEDPAPPDLLLFAEVSATTQDYDLGAKAALYASAGIAEYWVVDLRDLRIVVHRNPVGEICGSIMAFAADEAVSPLAAEASSIRLRELLP